MKRFFRLFAAVMMLVAGISANAQYKVSFKWDNPDAVSVIAGNGGTLEGDIAPGSTSCELVCGASIYIIPAEGYVLTSVVCSNSTSGKSENISGNKTYGQICSIYVGASLDGGSVTITTAKLNPTASMTVDVINGAEYLEVYLSGSWTTQDGRRCGYYSNLDLSDGENVIRFDPEYSQSCFVQPAPDSFVKTIFSVKQNGQDIDGTGNNSYFNIGQIADKDRISIRVFENEPPKIEYVTLSVSMPEQLEGCIYSIRDWTTDKFVNITDGKLELIKDTDIQFNFNKDFSFSRFLLGDKDISDLYNASGNKIRFTVTESTTFTIEGNEKDYGDKNLTVYVMNPEGLKVAVGSYSSPYNPISDLAEGAPVPSDIRTPDITFSDKSGASTSIPGSVMTPDDSKKFTLKISDKSPYLYVAPMPGYYVQALWNHDMTETLPYVLTSDNLAENVVYVIVKEIHEDYNAEIEVIGTEKIVFSPSQNIASNWNNMFRSYDLTEGKQTINFDPEYNLPFSLRPLTAFDSFAAYLDGLKLSADENGMYSVDFYAGESSKTGATDPEMSRLLIYADKSIESKFGNVKVTVYDNKTLQTSYGNLKQSLPANCALLAGTTVTIRPMMPETALTLNGEIIYGYDNDKLINKLTDGAFVFTVENGKNYIFTAEEDLNVPAAVDTISGNDNECARIYNLQGIYVGSDFESLPAGIYIVNGLKCIK